MKLRLIVVINLLCCVFCDDDERKLSVALNPDCDRQIGGECEDITFVHVKAEGADSVLNYLWDFTGTPSFFLAKTDKNTSLYIDWSNFLNGVSNTVSFSSEPEYVFSTVISKIFLFNDPNDNADISDESVKDITTIDTHPFKWNRENLTQLQDQQVVLVMKSSMKESNGSFSIEVIVLSFLLIC